VDSVSILRQQLKDAHGILEGTMQDVTSEQAHWSPPGIANPLGASYAHLVLSEDGIINGMLKKGAPLAATAWAGKVGISEPPPQNPADPWNQWARRVQVDLSALRQYAQAVYAASDEYLASLKVEDLNQPLDLSAFGLGEQTVGWMLNNAVVGHVSNHCGEVSCLKGLQGVKGYPF
jgi:hypothetical protein